MRVVPIGNAFGRGTGWLPVKATTTNHRLETSFESPAGGWYRLELRSEGGNPSFGAVEPVGVGDLFLVAGQSYAANTGDERLRIEDPEGRVVAYDPRTNTWDVANDPQPNPSGSDGGTMWPAAMNSLVPLARVPIGMVNVAIGGTAIREWLPGVTIQRVQDGPRYRPYEDLVAAGKALGRFRAVLWQQGESDVIENTPAGVYEERLSSIAEVSAREWSFRPLWLLAKSTSHPTVYNKPQQEAAIREAIDRLSRQAGFAPGPDTDILGEVGLYRGGIGSRRHFAGPGQRAAGLLWFAALWNALYRESTPDR